MKNTARIERMGANATVTLDSGAVASTDADPNPITDARGNPLPSNCWAHVTIHANGVEVAKYARSCMMFTVMRKAIDKH